MAVAERKPLTKKMRFDVFKRDSFVCQYCGSTPPKAVLEVDHINPVANGGKNSLDNLITSCFDCNRGKGAGLLTSIPESVERRAEVMAEKMEQIKAFNRMVKANEKRLEKEVDEVQEAFEFYHPGYSFADKFRRSVRLFLEKVPAHTVVDFMHRACCRIKSRDDALKYFCGICWKHIKECQ